MNERSDTERIKAQLAADVVRIIAEQKLSDAAASERLDLTAAELAKLRMFGAQIFGIDRLIGFLNAFDRQVEVKIAKSTGNPLQSLVERVAAMTADTPPDAWDKVPTDLAANVDHYLYGAPKRD